MSDRPSYIRAISKLPALKSRLQPSISEFWYITEGGTSKYSAILKIFSILGICLSYFHFEKKALPMPVFLATVPSF